MLKVVTDLFSLSYYLPLDSPVVGQTVLVYLEGGGACFNAASCKHRCAVGSSQADRCSQHKATVKNLTGSIWSGSKEENPGLWSSYKIFVPYCTSDVFSGRRGADEETAGFTFHGKYVVEAVVDDLLTEVFNNFEITQFVFMGASAGQIVLHWDEPQAWSHSRPGAFGVANNCDWVASQVRKSSAGANVRCVMDGLDFFPTSNLVPGCNPFFIRNLAAQFWKAEVDQSCEEANREDRKKCLVFTTSHQYIETPFMVIVPYEDTNNQVLLLRE